MSDLILIPRSNSEHTNFPCWIPTQNTKGEELRPHVRCNCGATTSVGNHHVHKDGSLTASYFHDPSKMPDGCGWHVYLKFNGYDGSEWLPGRTQEEMLKEFE